MKVTTTILLLCLVFPLHAQDGLYAPTVPEDASLVRVINATAGPVTLDIGPLRFEEEPYSASAYRPLQPGVFLINHAGEREVLTPQPRSFLSVVLLPASLRLVADERHTDPARAQLVLYNFSAESIDLRAIDPDAVIVAGIDPGAEGTRTVNAISLEVGAFAGEQAMFSTHLDLERGSSYAIVVLGPTMSTGGFVVQAAVAPE